jgi:HEAT repeat protein
MQWEWVVLGLIVLAVCAAAVQGIRKRLKQLRLGRIQRLAKNGEDERLLAMLNDRDWEIRWEAGRAMRRMGGRALQLLIGALGAEEPHVRDAAVDTLDGLKDERLVAPLLKILRKERERSSIGDSAWVALLNVGDAATGRLVRAVKRWPKDVLRPYNVREALERITGQSFNEDAEWVDWWNLYYGDQEDTGRARSRESAKKTKKKAARKKAARKKGVRKTAVEKTDQIAEFIGALEPDIAEGRFRLCVEPEKCYQAVDELTRIGGPAIPRLCRLLSKSSFAHLALGRIGGDRAFKVLRNELQADAWERTAAAAEALGIVGNPAALEDLRYPRFADIAEVDRAARKAVARLELAREGDKAFDVNESEPYSQISEIWELLRDILKDEARTRSAIQWWQNMCSMMAELPFKDTSQRGHAWLMLGVIINELRLKTYRFFEASEVSPEALDCLRKCIELAPDESFSHAARQLLDRAPSTG